MEYLYCISHTFRLEREIKKLQKEGNSDSIQHLNEKLTQLRRTAAAEKRDAAILGLIDGFMESALQLSLQLYLSIRFNLPLNFARGILLCNSSKVMIDGKRKI